MIELSDFADISKRLDALGIPDVETLFQRIEPMLMRCGIDETGKRIRQAEAEEKHDLANELRALEKEQRAALYAKTGRAGLEKMGVNDGVR